MASPFHTRGTSMVFDFGVLKVEDKKVKNSIMICTCNETQFAFVHQALSFNENIDFDLTGYHVVVLSPLQAGKNISIIGRSILNLSSIKAVSGEINIKTDEVFKNIGGAIESYGDIYIKTPASRDINIDIILARKEMILELFKEAILKQNGDLVINALVETYHAIRDPRGNNPLDDDQSFNETLQFFNIPRMDIMPGA